MKVRNVSEHVLTVLGRTVAPDEVVEFDAAEVEGYVLPESLWAPVGRSKSKDEEK